MSSSSPQFRFPVTGLQTSTTRPASTHCHVSNVRSANITGGSPYEVLKVAETATLPEIKAAYRNLAKKLHPDVASPGADSSEFMELQRAYAILSDPVERGKFDRSFRRRFEGTEAGQERFRVTRRWETDQCW